MLLPDNRLLFPLSKGTGAIGKLRNDETVERRGTDVHIPAFQDSSDLRNANPILQQSLDVLTMARAPPPALTTWSTQLPPIHLGEHCEKHLAGQRCLRSWSEAVLFSHAHALSDGLHAESEPAGN